ncbi:hypothetical protein AB0O07_19155 [Streptomyces sp. NPDC093085]|uniref:hypothetical protein n=1 Tax=Streptomyces sp. NPDC093085 TaxID=3155068 RepID=UPI0034215A22
MAGEVNLDEIATAHDTLVLEGPVGVGKSTLAHRLSVRHGFQVVHSPRTPDHLDLATRYREILSGPGRILFDRCFVSELVYGPLRRGRSRITWSEALDLAESVIDRKGLFIHLTAPEPIIRRRLLGLGGETETLDEVAALVAGYQRVFTTLADYTKVLAFDTTALELPSAR